jgi:hypothetical protein
LPTSHDRNSAVVWRTNTPPDPGSPLLSAIFFTTNGYGLSNDSSNQISR